VTLKTTRLTGLLHELEDLLDEVGSPFSSYALPGIDDDQIDELLTPLGFLVPTELREWFRWHHGARTDTRLPKEPSLGPGWWELMTIPEALVDRDQWINSATDPDEGWLVGQWLPFAYGGADHPRLVARLENSTDELVCVGWWNYMESYEAPPEGSLADVVDVFLRALREGQIFRVPGGNWDQGPRRNEFPGYIHL